MKLGAWLGSGAALVVIVGGLWTAGHKLATDVELMAVAMAASIETEKVAKQHEKDQVTAAEARKNDRVDRVERDMVKQERLLRSNLTPQDREAELRVLHDMKTLRQNILDGKR